MEQSEGQLPVPSDSSAGSVARKRAAISFWLLATAVVVILGGLRLIHLGADTPAWVSPSAAPYVDEGYKTLSARNLVVYGKTHWNASDDYPGWMKMSPIPSWSYYAAFRLFSPRLDVARGVSILYFSLFLLVWMILLRKRYPLPVLLAGLMLVGVDPGLFFYSRLALLEVPMIFALYSSLFLLACFFEKQVWIPLALAIGITPILALGIKMSALIYLAPVIGALLLRATLLRNHLHLVLRLGIAFAIVLVGVVVGVATRRFWVTMLDVDPLDWVRKFLTNPLATTSPFLFLAGWVCGVHLIIQRPSHVLTSSFRTALFALALLGPLALSLFPYDPPRYSVPFIPAYALIICEWLAAPTRAWDEHEMRRPAAATMILGVAAALMFGVDMTHRFGLSLLRKISASTSWLQGEMKVGLVFLLSLAITLTLYWMLGKKLLDRRKVAIMLGVCALFLGGYSTLRVGSFFLHPVYQGDLLRTEIARAIPEQSSLIGDWAPFFAIGTDLRPLYMCNEFNQPSRLLRLRPGYFLYSDTITSQVSLARIRRLNDVTLGPTILRGEYNHKAVILYALRFNSTMAATKSGGGKSNLR